MLNVYVYNQRWAPNNDPKKAKLKGSWHSSLIVFEEQLSHHFHSIYSVLFIT